MYKLSKAVRSNLVRVIADELQSKADELVSAIADDLEDALNEAYSEGYQDGIAECGG